MFRIALKGILARRRRLLMTSLVIVIGVAFIAGTAVLSDVLSRSVDELVEEGYRNTDVVVRSAEAEENPFSTTPLRKPIPAETLDYVEQIDGVAAAVGNIEAKPQMLGKDGEAISGFVSETRAMNWVEDDRLAAGTLREGRAPRSPDEAVLDYNTAQDQGFVLGDDLTLQFPNGAATFEIVGLGGLGPDGTKPTGTRVVLLEEARLQELAGIPGQFDRVSAAAEEGVTQEELAERIAVGLPDGIEAVTGQAFIAETQQQIAQILDVVEDLISAFGYLAAFVAVFVIYNIFSILIAQRTRELALLRAVGASRTQIMGSVMFEALVVGALAAALGLVAGYGLATLLKGLLSDALSLSEGATRLTSSAVVRSLVVGVLATVVSAIIPAIRATRIPPVAAMSETALEQAPLSWTRKLVGTLAFAGGMTLVLLAVNEQIEPPLNWTGIGAGLIFVSLVMVGPVFAGPISRIIGRPLPTLRGAPGRLARDNASRNPKRTTSTGVALTIGVAVVAVIAVVASSFKFSLADAFETQLKGDLIISGGFGSGGFDPDLADTVREVDGVASLTSLAFGPGCSLDSPAAEEFAAAAATTDAPDTDSDTCKTGTSAGVDGESVVLVAIDPATFFDLIDVGNVVPSTDALRDDTIALQDTVLEDNGWEIGDEVRMWSTEVGEQTFTIAATYDQPFGGGGSDQYVVTDTTFERVSNPIFQLTNSLYVKVDEGRSIATVQHDIEEVIQPIAPAASVEDVGTFVREQTEQLEGFLNIIYVLLLLAIIVAVAGISITMSLSVYERTRELGLLRAIGMERRQMRSSVRWEAAVISLFGTMLGLVIGLGLSIAFVQGFADQGIRLDLPWVNITVIAVGGAIAGLLAARRPAKRAAGLDILDAIHQV